MLKSKRILLAVLTMGLLVAGCKTEEKVKPATITAKAGDDQQVKVGDIVSLDGGGSADSQNKPLQYRWEFLKKPAGSNTNFSRQDASKVTFIPDIAGEYEINLKVSGENGESSDKVLVTAATIQPIELARDIREKTVLEDRIANPNLPDYIVNANTQVNAELNLKPGVVIAFARDTRLEVNANGGVLIAKGDTARPIRLIGKEAVKGYWAGVLFRSGSSANALDYFQVLHAGGRPLMSAIQAGMVVAGTYKANLSIKNSLFAENAGFGLYLDEGVLLSGFEKNTFRANSEAGISLSANLAGKLDYNSSFTNGNGRDVVEIFASTLQKNANSQVVWAGFKDGTPYRIIEGIGSEANWKINPGVTIEMGQNVRLSIDGGYFNAVGTKNSRITIRAAENQRAYWRGIICFASNGMNKMEYADLSGGGSTSLVSGKKAMIAVYGGGASMEIRDSKFSGSGGYGAFINYQATVNEDIETSNVFTDNTDGKVFRE